MVKLKVTLQQFLAFALLHAPVCASLVDTTTSYSSDTACVADILVEGKESFADETNPRAMHSVYKTQVIQTAGCDFASAGDSVYFAGPGGRIGEIGVKVNGIDIEVGDRAAVELTAPSTSLGIPYLVKAEPLRQAQTNDSQLFMCSRSTPSSPSFYWPSRQVTMHPAGSNDDRVSQSDLIDAMTWAANQWSHNDCSDFRFVIGEPVTQRWTGYDWTEGAQNRNLVTLRRTTTSDFYGEWLYATNLLALTSITYISRSGEIVDADIELNGTSFRFTNCDGSECTTVHDLKNTLTHEFGHVLGLFHPNPSVAGANETTMFAQSGPGETKKRTLSQGDVDGVCFIYPSGSMTRECFGVTRKADPALKIVSGTSGCTQTEQGNRSLLPLACLVFVYFCVRRRTFLCGT